MAAVTSIVAGRAGDASVQDSNLTAHTGYQNLPGSTGRLGLLRALERGWGEARPHHTALGEASGSLNLHLCPCPFPALSHPGGSGTVTSP